MPAATPKASDARCLYPEHTFEPDTGFADYCALTPDGAIAVTAGYDKIAYVWDVRERALLAKFERHEGRITGCAVSADGATAATASYDDGSVRVWDARNGEQVYEIHRDGLSGAPYCALTPDGRVLAASFQSGMKKGCVVVCEWRTGAVLREWTAPAGFYAIAMSADASIVAYISKASRFVWSFDAVDVTTGNKLHSADVGNWNGREPALAMNSSGSRVVVASDEEHLVVYNTRDGSDFKLPHYFSARQNYCTITPDGSRVVAAVHGGKHAVWDLDSRSLVAFLQGSASDSSPCAVSADGTFAFTCGAHNPQIWSLGPPGTVVNAAIAGEEGQQYAVRVVVLGGPGRGKTSTLNRLLANISFVVLSLQGGFL